MKIKLNNKYVRWGVTAFSVIAATICFYYLIFHMSSLLKNLASFLELLMPIIFGLATAYLLTPLLNVTERKVLIPICNRLKLPDNRVRRKAIRAVGIMITAFLMIFLIYILCAMLLSQIVPSIQSIIANFDIYLDNIIAWVNDLLANNPVIKNYVLDTIDRYSLDLENWLNETLLTQTSALIKTVSLSVLSTLSVLWDFIVGFIISIYVLSMKETLAAQAKKVTFAVCKKKETANVVINNFRFTHQTFIGFVGGKIVDSLIIGVLCFVGTSILKTPYAALVSVVIGVTNVIPFFGPFLGAIPTGILIFVVDPMNPLNCVYYLLFILVLQQFDGNILGPKILGNSTGISGFWVITSITLFGGILGVPGMIVGVPLFAVIYAILKANVATSLRRKDLPEKTADYMNLGAMDEEGIHSFDDTAYNACKGKRFYSNSEEIKIDLKREQKDEQLCAKSVLDSFKKRNRKTQERDLEKNEICDTESDHSQRHGQ